MCLVEIKKMPKLQISCYTQAQDDMEVVTDSDTARVARQNMLEFLLINHPLDCPVCDQSGECDLQNFYMEHGRYKSQFLENKIKRKKAFPIGPHVLLDQERCILCTRCTRFTEEITETNELGCFNRGNRSVIDLYPGQELDNPYSGNVIDICPVGALTEREFRFRCRVWYLDTQKSICTGCSRGCNISIHFNKRRGYKADGRRVQRLKPRYNPHVNQWWMSDQGRFGFEFIDQDRIEFPYLSDGVQQEISDWPTVLERAAALLRETLEKRGPAGLGVIMSPQMSNEEFFAARQLFREELGVEQISFENPWEEPGFEDDFLLRADRNPNSRGARELELAGDTKTLLKKAADGEIETLFIFHHRFEQNEPAILLEKASAIIYQGTNWNSVARMAAAVLPGATYAEKEGTFTNFEGRVQRFHQAFLPLEESRSDIEILVELASRLEVKLEENTADKALKAWLGLELDEVDDYGFLLSEISAVTA